MCHLDTKIELAKIELTEDREVEAEERIGKIGDQMDGGQTLVRQTVIIRILVPRSWTYL